MSGRRSQAPGTSSHITELLLKLSDEINRNAVVRGSSEKLIRKACKHIAMLNEEIENLSEQIAELIDCAKISKHELKSLTNYYNNETD